MKRHPTTNARNRFLYEGQWDDKTRRLAEELLAETLSRGGSIDTDISYPAYCIETDEFVENRITHLLAGDGTLLVEANEYTELRRDPITEYRPHAVRRIHDAVFASLKRQDERQPKTR